MLGISTGLFHYRLRWGPRDIFAGTPTAPPARDMTKCGTPSHPSTSFCGGGWIQGLASGTVVPSGSNVNILPPRVGVPQDQFFSSTTGNPHDSPSRAWISTRGEGPHGVLIRTTNAIVGKRDKSRPVSVNHSIVPRECSTFPSPPGPYRTPHDGFSPANNVTRMVKNFTSESGF